jgi:hypothetical protein
VQVVREDPKNKNLLYAGTEFGLFISLDAGKSWEKFMTGYPTVRTDDILVHPRDGDLIVASHGRSIFIADDVTPLQQLTPAAEAQDVVLFDPRPAIAYQNDFHYDEYVGGNKQFEGENAPRGTALQFYLKSNATGDAKLSVLDLAGKALCETTVAATAGIHRVQWSLATPLANAGGGRGGRGGAAGGAAAGSCSGGGGGGRGGAGGGAAPGTYTVKLNVGGRDHTKTVQVLEDRWAHEK